MKVSRRNFLLFRANLTDDRSGFAEDLTAGATPSVAAPAEWLTRLYERGRLTLKTSATPAVAAARAWLLARLDAAIVGARGWQRPGFGRLALPPPDLAMVARSAATVRERVTIVVPRRLPIAPLAGVGRAVLPRLTRAFLAHTLLFVAVLVTVLTIVSGFALYGYLTRDLPPADQVFSTGMFQTTMIYDRRGRLLYEMVDPNGGKRNVVRLRDIPSVLIDATVMTEDANFYSNPGVDPVSILRALVQDLRQRRIMSGASTITQQLVRNVVMTPRERQSRTLQRKIGEAILAFRVSQRYSKEEILERYLNEIYYGNLAYGVEAASETYFDKPVQQLTLPEAALIAGLPQAPALYDPYQHPEAAKQRQREVLSLMVKHGAITQDQADAAALEPLRYHSLPTGLRAPHFVMYVRDLLEQRYSRTDLYQKGMHVYTSLDLDLQSQVEAIVQAQLPAIAGNDASNAAVVVIDPKTGEIRAMVGSADFWNDAIQGQIDVTTTDRPPASTIKPFTYLVAFDRHLEMPATIVTDSPVQYPMGNGRPPYQPQDADGKFRGPVTVRRALANSLNVPAVETLDRIGVGALLSTLHRLGITSLPHPSSYYGLALTLGEEPVQLLDLTYAYATLANQGVQIGEPVAGADPDERQYAPVAILKITDAQGNVLDEYHPPDGLPVISRQAAWLTTSVLQDDAARAETLGQHSPLELADRPAAAKTGASENLRDAWTIGYTPEVAVGVWVGNSDNHPMKAPFGALGPAVIWHLVMEAALAGQPAEQFVQPAGLVRATVDAETGLLPVPGRPTIADWFVQGTVPTQSAPVPTPTPAPPKPNPAPAPAPAPAHPGKGRGGKH